MSDGKTVLFPLLKWAQRDDVVLLTIDVQDAQDVKLQLPKDGAALDFSCSAVAQGDGAVQRYACQLDLFAAVSPEESDFVARPRQIEVKLAKRTDAGDGDEAFWPRLTKDKSKNKNITIDWSRWKDEDDEDEGDLGDFGMGGLGGLTGNDEDDEELTQKMIQQFAVSNAKGEAEGAAGHTIPEFGSAEGQAEMAGGDAAADDDDDDMPPLEEDA